MPVYFILIRRQESSPGLWCCRGWAGGRLRDVEDHSDQEGSAELGGGNALHRFHEFFHLSCRELYQLIKIQFADWIAMIGLAPRPPSRDPGPGKKLLFFLDGVDELRLLCEEHTEDLLRWGRAWANAPPTEQMVWPHSHCPDHHNPLHAFSLMYSAQASRWPEDLRGPCCLAAQRIWEQEILCNKFQIHELDLPFPECKYEVFQKDDDFENCSFIHLNIRGLGNYCLLSGNKQE